MGRDILIITGESSGSSSPQFPRALAAAPLPQSHTDFVLMCSLRRLNPEFADSCLASVALRREMVWEVVLQGGSRMIDW